MIEGACTRTGWWLALVPNKDEHKYDASSGQPLPLSVVWKAVCFQWKICCWTSSFLLPSAPYQGLAIVTQLFLQNLYEMIKLIRALLRFIWNNWSKITSDSKWSRGLGYYRIKYFLGTNLCCFLEHIFCIARHYVVKCYSTRYFYRIERASFCFFYGWKNNYIPWQKLRKKSSCSVLSSGNCQSIWVYFSNFSWSTEGNWHSWFILT